MEWSEGGGKWDNCNSIINKYIKKKEICSQYCYFNLKQAVLVSLNIHIPGHITYIHKYILYDMCTHTNVLSSSAKAKLSAD